MTDRFVTVPDSLELPAAVKVPVARLVGPTGAAATPADLGAATAAQGAKADASDVDQITLTGDLVLTLPVGRPAGQVYRVTLTQDGTGGHTVTYDGASVTVDTSAGASTLVEIWPGGEVIYPGAVGSGGLTTEGVQDVVGAMVTAAGGTYNDAAGTITLPGGSSSAITADDTPAAPAEGASASYLVTSAVSWPAGLEWSTDPDGGTAPTITGTALVSMFTVGGVTRAIMGATFPAVVAPDTTNPSTVTGLTATATGPTTVDLAWSAATDNVGVTGYEYRIDGGAAVDAGAGTTETVTGLTAGTLYSFEVRAYDAADNRSAAWSTAATATTTAPDMTAPVWTATLTPGTPTATSVVVTASALATDANTITYERTLDSTAGTPVWDANVPSGLNFTLSGLTSGTVYANCALRAKDAAGNVSTPLAVPSFTTAEAASSAFFTDFSEYATGVAPSDWSMPWVTGTPVVEADATATGGKVLNVIAGGGDNRTMHVWNTPGTAADSEIVMRWRPVSGIDAIGRAGVRTSGTGTSETGIVGYVASSSLKPTIAQYNNASAAVLNEGTSVPAHVVGSWYWLRVRVVGTTATARFWADGASEPGTWNATGTTAVTGAGNVGVMVFTGTVDIDLVGVGMGTGVAAPTTAV